MLIVDCPWCEGPVALERPDILRCEECRTEVEIDPPALDAALAA